jgi:hypothetical protein
MIAMSLIFSIQSEIAKTIANQLQAKLSTSEKAAIAEPANDRRYRGPSLRSGEVSPCLHNHEYRA